MENAIGQRQPAVSIVVPCYNESQNIRSCLGSLLNQATRLPYEIIVVDSSSDGTPRIIREEFPQVRLIHYDHQTYPAEARNIGTEQARAPVIAFVDADSAADSAWLESIARAHRQEHLVIGGSVSLARPFTLAGAMLFAIEFSEFVPTSRPRQIRWLPSCNLSLKRGALECYGGFPTEMEASEDMLYSRSLMVQSGVPLWFDPGIRIFHANRNSLADYRRRLAKLGYWSAVSRISPAIPGGVLLRHPVLIPLLVPYRLVMILGRLFVGIGQRRLFFLSLLSCPLLVYGLVCWARGFWQGAHQAPDLPDD